MKKTSFHELKNINSLESYKNLTNVNTPLILLKYATLTVRIII